jgi:hypothetical protein
MNEIKPFTREVPPSDESLITLFGTVYSSYLKLMEMTASFSHAWHFSKSSGWMLKVFERQKALLYLILLEGGFKLSMAVREDERQVLLQDAELASLHEQLSTAKKYAEGYALQFEIRSGTDFNQVEPFISKLICLRTNG